MQPVYRRNNEPERQRVDQDIVLVVVNTGYTVSIPLSPINLLFLQGNNVGRLLLVPASIRSYSIQSRKRKHVFLNRSLTNSQEPGHPLKSIVP